MMTQDDRRARARIKSGGGVHALLIGATDRAEQFSVGRDADKVIQQLELELVALKHQLEVAHYVAEARRCQRTARG